MIEGQQDEGDGTPFQSLLNCLKRKQVNTKFPIFLSSFIKSNPPKKELQEISNAFIMSKKEGIHYRELTDIMVVILKLLLNYSLSDQNEDLDKKFDEKFKIFQKKLKNSDVDGWILDLRETIITATRLKQKQRERKRLKDMYVPTPEIKLAKDLQKMTLEKNQLAKAFQRIALILYEYSEVQRRAVQPVFYEQVAISIEELKKKLITKDQALTKQRKVSEKLKQLGMKYNIKSSDGVEILKQLEGQIRQHQAKLSFINTRLQNFKKNENDKDDRIASLRIKLEKYDEQIKAQKSKVQQLQAKQEEILCKNFMSTSEIIQPHKTKQISFLRNAIKDLTDVQGTRCKLLYTSNQPKAKNRNFHQFIDNKPNILLLILLDNGSIIGGFSREQFRAPRCNGQQGFIFNVNHMQAYERQQRSTISYDDYYIIFGNSEICIKVNDMHVLSNFAIQARHFNSKNRDVNFFLGDTKREAEMKIYEIYQVLTE